MTIGPVARVMGYVSPRVDDWAPAGAAGASIAAISAVLKMHRTNIASLRRGTGIRSFDTRNGTLDELQMIKRRDCETCAVHRALGVDGGRGRRARAGAGPARRPAATSTRRGVPRQRARRPAHG